jgi:hypothetical protein
MADQKSDKEAGATILGPVDLLVLQFPVNNFKGEIMRNLYELVAAGTIRIIDLVMITKSQEGHISAINLHELGTEASQALGALHATVNQMITIEDITAIGEDLDPNSSAGILLFENVWAIKTKQAMVDAGGKLVYFARIPDAVVQEAVAELAVMSQQLV